LFGRGGVKDVFVMHGGRGAGFKDIFGRERIKENLGGGGIKGKFVMDRGKMGRNQREDSNEREDYLCVRAAEVAKSGHGGLPRARCRRRSESVSAS
jgi:hypothetical protein